MAALHSPLVGAFLDYLRYERRSSIHTLKAYQNDLASLGRFLFPDAAEPLLALDEAAIRQLTRNQLRAWLIAEPDLAPTTIRQRVAAVRGLCKHAMRMGLLQANPAARLPLPKLPRRLATFVPEADLARLLETAPFPAGNEGLLHRLVLELIYGCGLRRSEVLGLRWQDVLPTQHLLRVLGKGKKERLVPYGPPVASLLDAWRAACEEMAETTPCEWVLQRPDGEPISDQQIYRIVKRYLSAIPGLAKSSPHVLRHSYATHLVNNGANLNAVKDLLGHASLAATQVYVHNSVKRFKETYRKSHPRAQES